MLSWLEENAIYTKRLSELCAKEYSGIYMEAHCICTLYLNALPGNGVVEGFCNPGCRPCQQGAEGAWLILKVRCE